MNERGDITLFTCLIIFAFVSILLLSALELKRSFHHLQQRTKLFLCIKESKEEIHDFMTFIGRTNWGIKNINKASMIMMFIPGLQGASMNAQKMKKILQNLQTTKITMYLNSIKRLKQKKCQMDPRIYLTPVKVGQRTAEGALILRSKEWTYGYFSKPYFLTLKIDASNWEDINPKIVFESQEKTVKSFYRSLLQ
jgi:hypothetical protein